MQTPRILNGIILRQFDVQWPEGPEQRVLAKVNVAQEWEIPTEWFTRAGHLVLEIGMKFKVASPTPEGLPPKVLSYVLPPEATE